MRFVVLALLGLLALPTAATAAPVLHAHRGGAISFGMPDSYEDTQEAFQRRVQESPGVWLEMDSLVSKDGVPYVLHDSTLDRTTTCTGNVIDRTAAEIDACRVDVLGVASGNAATAVPAPAGGPVVRVPRLADVLAFAKTAGAPINLEIKRIPGDPGYTPGDETFATQIMQVVKAAGLPPEKLIIQSFDPTNLDTAKTVLPGVTLSYLTAAGDAGGVVLCAARGYAYLSPSGVPTAATMQQAKAAGVKVVPYTLDSDADVKAAAAAGVDAIITNDIPLARKALGPGAGTTGSAGGTGTTGPTGSGSDAGPGATAAAAAASAPPAGAAGPTGATAPTTKAVSPATLTLSSRRRAATLRLRGLAVRLRGPAGTRATVSARAGRVLVARGTVALTMGGSRRVRVPLTDAGRRLLRRRGAVTLTVRTVVAGKALTLRLVLR